MFNLKSLKWEIGLASALGLALLLNGVKASPSFDQAVLTASSNATQNSSPDSDLYSQFSDSPQNPNGNSPYLPGDNSQFDNGNSNFGNSFSQAPSSRPHTRTRRS